MLEVITLFVIDKIFSGAEIKLGATSRAIYISCLINFFKHKEATRENAKAFNVFTSDIPNYDNFKKNFQELHKAGIVTINGDELIFNNMWGAHIDWSKIKEPVKRGYVGNRADEEKIKSNTELIELCRTKYFLQEHQVNGMVKMFVMEQCGIQKEYVSDTEMFNHFYRWIGTNTDKAPPKEIVKSKGKLLGK